MTYTTGVAFGLTLLIEIFLSFQYGGSAADVAKVDLILATLDSSFYINPVFLIPPVLVIIVAYRRMPAIPGIMAGAAAAAVLGIALQGNTFEEVLNVSFGGFSSETGIEEVDTLLSKGGMDSMMYTIAIIIVAMMFGGIAERTGQMRVIVEKLLEKAKTTGSLIVSTVLTCIAANILLCDQYMAIVMGGRMYSQAYRERGLHPKNLSRAVEDSATVTANLVPWNSGGAYQAGVLGVATIAYLPFAFFCWLSPIITIIFGVMGWTIQRVEDDPDTVEEFIAMDAEDK